ncbi:diguanylate cyclase domain-containing protein [Castellaniella sp.]|uniref:diguanylate cyclase domain-containing protein n=1 Tax=Castellaniella sp. TaxID=1955812 RepID=UPI002AFE011B|nr:diguanylate cyclase [Castellaniella sp.]
MTSFSLAGRRLFPIPWLRSLKHKVLIAFVMVAVLAVINVLLVRSLLNESDGIAATVNVAGKMRMLSQKIALEALTGSPETEFQASSLAQQEQLFEQAYQALRSGGILYGQAIPPVGSAQSDQLAAVSRDWRIYRRVLAGFMQSEAVDAGSLLLLQDPVNVRIAADRLLGSAEALLDALVLHARKVQQGALYSAYGLFVLDLFLLLLAYWLVSRQVLRPMHSLAQQCRELAAGNYAVRSQLDKQDELGRLGEALNASAAHIERLFAEVSRERASLRLAEASTRRAALVYAHTSEAMVVTDANGWVQDINPAFTAITGYTVADIIGKRMSVLSSGRHGRDFYQTMWQCLAETGRWSGDVWNRRKSGEEYVERLTINTSYNEDGSVNCRIGLFSDVTEKRRREASIWRQAHYDHLTQLPNRQMFQANLLGSIEASRASGLPFALVFLDLDLFKEVNDTFGHDQGDELLRQAARRLMGCVRNSDMVARLGGDEFTLIIRDLPHGDDVHVICRKILDVVAQPYDLGGREARISASMGVAFYPNDGTDAADLLKQADRAMYASKEKGRNQYSLFSRDMLASEDDQSLLQAG